MPAAPVGMTYRHLGTMEHNVCDILAQRMKHNKTSWTVSRPAFAGKAAIMVTTSGSGSSNHSLLTMDIALRSWGFHIAGKNKFRMGGAMVSNEIGARYDKKIKNIASKLFKTLRYHKVINPSFYSLIVFKVQQKYWQKTINRHDTFDFCYWEKNGWLQSNCSYYIEHHANVIKVKFACITGEFISTFFT
jgi:hypothetical protein